MKVNDVNSVVGPERAKPVETGAQLPPAPKDKVTVGDGQKVDAAVSVARSSAGASRAARAQQLEAQVRAGGYRPDPSRVAEQILNDAEIDARLAAMLRHG